VKHSRRNFLYDKTQQTPHTHQESRQWASFRTFHKRSSKKTRRIRSGAAKREKSQLLVTKAPDVLDSIMMDAKASPKHRIDASKTLDAFADNGPQSASEADWYHIVINLGNDTKLVFDGVVKPTDPNDTNIIDGSTPQEVLPPRRGPGRPPGSKNKPKIEETETAPRNCSHTSQRATERTEDPVANLFERLSKNRPAPVEEKKQQHNELIPAQKLLTWLQRGPGNNITVRDIRVYGPHSIRDRRGAIDAAEVLVANGWLIPIKPSRPDTYAWQTVRKLIINPR
jgi:hypothetical protein